MDRTKIKNLILTFFVCYLIGACAFNKVIAEDNDTAFTSNILPNAGDTTSSYSNANLDGVTTGSSATTLTNNLVYNGFTITCDTQVSNACGSAHPSIGELEASHDMTVTATGSLVGVTGTSTPDGLSHTSTQAKLNGGINLNSSVSVQNCEWSSSNYRCGSYTGAVDSYTITMKIKDSDGNVLASSTKIRTDDAGYNANARTFDDNLHYNGVHANTYEWSWKGVDGSESTSVAVRGPNLLGAEMALDFPTDDYEALSQAEIEEINEALGTANLTESEIWNVVSGIEESIGMELNVATEGVVTSVELNEETMQVIVHTSREASVKEVAKVQEVIQTMNETKAVETLKKEVIQEVMKEIYEEPKTTQTKSFAMVSKEKAVSSKKEETKVSKAPPGMTPAKEEEKEEVKEEQPIVKETQEEKEVAQEESSTESSTEVSSASTSEQKKIQAKKALVKNLDRVMNRVDADIKDIAKNLQIKNLIKLEAMTSEQASLDLYANALFYKPKDIYLQQLNIFDNRQIYDNVNLASYIKTDRVAIKANALHEINLKKQRLLMELEQLKNGKI